MSEHPASSSTNQLAVDPLTRSADHNRKLADQVNPTSEDMLLPSLDPGITLLDIESGRGVPLLQSLVLDHLLLHNGPAFWIDAKGYATTTTLSRIAPSQRLLNRIHVARGFTAYQHYGAVCDLPSTINQSIQQATTHTSNHDAQAPGGDDESDPCTPSLIVAPAIDAQYRADDTLSETHAETLQTRTLAKLTAYASAYDVPVLVTRSKHDSFTTPVETVADHYLQCEQTQMGPRLTGSDFETLVYPVGDGVYYQTTFAYWRQLLRTRARMVGWEPAKTTQVTPTPRDVGTGVTADGDSVSLTADPLLDVWTAGVGGR